MESNGEVRITGYVIHIYRNEDNDLVLKQPDFYGDDSIIIIGKEQVDSVIDALRTLPFLG